MRPLLHLGVFLTLLHPAAARARDPASTQPPVSKRPAANPSAMHLPAADPVRCARLYQARRFRDAQGCFARLVAAGAQDPVLLYALGYCDFQLGDYRAALAHLRAALARQPRDGDTQFMVGVTLVKLRRYREAQKALRRALALGLDSESPAEARRALALLRRLLVAGPKRGLSWHVAAGAGYDSHPRLDGRAAAAGTSDGSTAEGSGFTTLDAGIRYRWRLGKRIWTTLAYGLGQRLVFSDLSTTVVQRAGRFAVAPPQLSLQRHRLAARGQWVGSRWSVGIRLEGDVELSGLDPIRGSTAAVTGILDGHVRWHRLTETRLALGVGPQWALDEALDYLDGTALWLQLTQRLTWDRLRADLSYHYAGAWLGTATQPESDCPHNVVCALAVPYRHQAHGVRLGLAVRATSWLRLRGAAGVTRRAYGGDTLYRVQAGRELTIRRVDITQRYDLGVDFRLVKGLTIFARYTFTLNHSTITEVEAGVDEGYQRHLATVAVRYER